MESLRATNFTLLLRKASPAFSEILTHTTDSDHPQLHPVIVYDLDGDGLSEIICGGTNTLFRNKGKGDFKKEKFLPHDFEIFDHGILADFTGDGRPDFVCVGSDRRPTLFASDGNSRFTIPGRRCATVFLDFPKAFTAGDIDRDGDLDLFIGQYKFLYDQGSMPTPFYDANDSHPAYLLVNDGSGNFTDATHAAGLAEKRFRRTYSCSFVDIDSDDDMDLITVNDFSGVDIYQNNGSARFSDITERALNQNRLFGMAHTIADFNGDRLLDFLAIGMSSTTARRLESMRLFRPGFEDIDANRPGMAYGNRLYLGDGKGGFRQWEKDESVARTGWAWGTSSFDFDNDGDRDIYIGNGHSSGRSSQDYCSTYWRHDLYAGNSDKNPVLDNLFGQSLRSMSCGDISWNGFEHNVLLMKSGDQQFVNVAHMMGVAFEKDSRAVISDDVDGDGQMDLVVVSHKKRGHNLADFALHVFRNQLNSDNHWIGIRFAEGKGKVSPIGSKITVRTATKEQTHWIVTGDSFSCQHAMKAHFGLGKENAAKTIEIRWPDGKIQTLDNPGIDTWHTVESLQ